MGVVRDRYLWRSDLGMGMFGLDLLVAPFLWFGYDMLRTLTGLNTQQHIHKKMIVKAKEFLAGGQLTIAEIAYQLGFAHPQSFSKIFKRKTSLSPNEYKQLLS